MSSNKTGRLEERMWRIHQRSVKFTDKKKRNNKYACRQKGKS